MDPLHGLPIIYTEKKKFFFQNILIATDLHTIVMYVEFNSAVHNMYT